MTAACLGIFFSLSGKHAQLIFIEAYVYVMYTCHNQWAKESSLLVHWSISRQDLYVRDYLVIKSCLFFSYDSSRLLFPFLYEKKHLRPRANCLSLLPFSKWWISFHRYWQYSLFLVFSDLHLCSPREGERKKTREIKLE
jgi:hypothetical protein